jgi:glycosyltransferase involved in cell wall biosynthesis
MKLLINTASTFKGGGIQVAISFLADCRQHPENEYHVVLGAALSKMTDTKNFPANFFFYPISYRPATKVFSPKSHNDFFKKLEEKIKPDVVFTTTGPAYWRPVAPHLVGYNLPHHVYPESPFFKKVSLYRRTRWKLKKLIASHFFKKDADAYVVQTDDINQRLRKLLGKEKVFTVSNTYSPFYNNPQTFSPKLPPRKNGEFRLLTLTAWYLHKNLDIIPKVVDALPEDVKANVKFVLTLPKHYFEKEVTEKYAGHIINAGPVKVEEGPSLYNECDAMFLPTLLECFSASYAEAMAMKKPILTSDMGFARTVCNDAAIYFNPVDAGEIARKIISLLKNETLQKELIEKGKGRMAVFGTSQQRTEEYLTICRQLMAGN